eukprot:CAMPEP_0203923388 /NCGR_PEP_ID=MMETSP0359-20131031/63307_1 /ASSEMBLY_ACC=CAM_ASM_000338 /TAXON_ID=268821 /ORGANISM="Scrippsiella Hangoei, Strain SHTV-5" /LENGTH=337 /DNA_ID=CAMNT_0050851463 /DNA_START=203 /DNA_END=1215 /DNA_ORIENTATION=+
MSRRHTISNFIDATPYPALCASNKARSASQYCEWKASTASREGSDTKPPAGGEQLAQLRAQRSTDDGVHRKALRQQGHPCATTEDGQSKAQQALQLLLHGPGPSAAPELDRGVELVFPERDDRHKRGSSLQREFGEALPLRQEQAHAARSALQTLARAARRQSDAVALAQKFVACLPIDTAMAMHQAPLAEKWDPEDGAMPKQVNCYSGKFPCEVGGVGSEGRHRRYPEDAVRVTDENVRPAIGRQRSCGMEAHRKVLGSPPPEQGAPQEPSDAPAPAEAKSATLRRAVHKPCPDKVGEKQRAQAATPKCCECHCGDRGRHELSQWKDAVEHQGRAV